MIIAFDKGHTLRGVGTGAVGIKSETGLNRPLGDRIINKLRQLGHTVIDCTVDEGINSLSQICANANRQSVDLFVSLHFNCGGGQGVEVLTYDSKSIVANTFAKKICDEISKLGFKNRGVKFRPDLHVLNSTKAEALIIEVAFIDSEYDMNLYNEDKVANAIVYAITGQTTIIQDNKPKKYWVVTNYIPKGEYGFPVKKLINDYFKDIPEVYINNNSTGSWIETCYLPKEKCEELKIRIGDLFWEVKSH